MYYFVVINEDEDNEQEYLIDCSVPIVAGHYIRDPEGAYCLVRMVVHNLVEERGAQEPAARYSSTKVYADIEVV